MCDNKSDETSPQSPLDAWLSVRGLLKDIYAEYGGGEAYIRKERESFYTASDSE